RAAVEERERAAPQRVIEGRVAEAARAGERADLLDQALRSGDVRGASVHQAVADPDHAARADRARGARAVIDRDARGRRPRERGERERAERGGEAEPEEARAPSAVGRVRSEGPHRPRIEAQWASAASDAARPVLVREARAREPRTADVRARRGAGRGGGSRRTLPPGASPAGSKPSFSRTRREATFRAPTPTRTSVPPAARATSMHARAISVASPAPVWRSRSERVEELRARSVELVVRAEAGEADVLAPREPKPEPACEAKSASLSSISAAH